MKAQLKVVTTNQFKIEKNIPVTSAIRGQILYPFADMVRGDSFFVAVPDNEYRLVSNRITRQMRMFARQYGNDYDFTTRRVVGGIRCWRVK